MTTEITTTQPEELLPTSYWGEEDNPYKWTDDKLRPIVESIAYTNKAITAIVLDNDMVMTQYYRLINRCPGFAQAIEVAKAIRNERLREEILQIADADLPDDEKMASLELQHRKLKIAARQAATKAAAQPKAMEKFSINVGSKQDDEGKPVTIVQINYGDK